MTTYIGLLRAVNLAGINKVAMADLRQMLVKQGMQNCQTLLQSGNVVFCSRVTSAAKIEHQLEEAAEKHLRVKTEFFVRSEEEWKAIVAANPFPDEARKDPGHLLMLCLKAAPERAAVTALQDAIVGREIVKAKGQQAYIVYPDGQGRSRLTTLLIEKKLGTRATGRNWNTVLKLSALADEVSHR
jgi:uncharacterized protein (DUF1697 family)